MSTHTFCSSVHTFCRKYTFKQLCMHFIDIGIWRYKISRIPVSQWTALSLQGAPMRVLSLWLVHARPCESIAVNVTSQQSSVFMDIDVASSEKRSDLFPEWLYTDSIYFVLPQRWRNFVDVGWMESYPYIQCTGSERSKIYSNGPMVA